MRIELLQLTNFRGIREVTLELHQKLTVLVGVNGAGKSSLLDALRFLLMRLVKGVQFELAGAEDEQTKRRHKESLFSLSVADVQNGQQSMQLGIRVLALGLSATWSIDSSLKPLGGFLESPGLLGGVDTLVRELGTRATSDADTSFPLAVYYRGGRYPAAEDVAPTPREGIQNQLSAYEGALTGEAISSADPFVQWFRQREDYENERRVETPEFRDAQLEAVRQAVKELLPGFDNLRYRRQLDSMVLQKGRMELELRSLSDGERYLLALGADITRRLALANPSAREPRLCSAVILIDEIDTHLHPLWQRRVIPSLERAFPSCQFIVATHSPQVLSEVRPDSIYLLEQKEGELRISRPGISFGRDTNRILEDVMGVTERPARIKERLDDYFHLLKLGRMEDARKLREQLAQEIGEDEPEFDRADMLIRAKELLSGENHPQGR